jgi:hypothetical protein
MRFARNLMFAILTIATCLPASAQKKAGSFTLPYETKWNKVAVPAGEYSISIYSQSHQIAMLRAVSGHQSAIFLVPVAHDYNDACSESTIRFTKVNGEWNASSACFAESGLTVFFAQPANTMVASTKTAAGSH